MKIRDFFFIETVFYCCAEGKSLKSISIVIRFKSRREASIVKYFMLKNIITVEF